MRRRRRSRRQFLSLGNHALTSQYSGDAYYAASTSPASTITVTQAQPFFNSYGWETFNQNVYVGQTLTATAHLYGSEAGVAPTGTILFFDNNVPFPGSVTYMPQPGMLTASASYTFTTAGTHDFTATYSGDVNYLSAVTSDPQVITVLGPVSAAVASSISIASPGQSGSTTLTLTPNQGFSGIVALSCTPDARAKESSCSFTSGSTTGSTLQVNLTGASTTVTFTATTTAPHALAQSQPAPPLGTIGIGFGALMTIFMLLGARPRKYCSAMALGSFLLVLLACGGGSSGTGGGGGGGGGGGSNTDPGTPAGQYSFTVTGVTGSGSTANTFNTPVTVVVQ